jgi:hypothetical protein
MPDSLTFATKDLGKKLIDAAGLSRLKFESDKIAVEVKVQAEELKHELKGKDWTDIEAELRKIFKEFIKELETSVAKKAGKADEEIKGFPPELYGNYLRPINIELERKFEDHCKRIHLAFDTELQAQKKKHGLKQDPKTRVEFDFACLESSTRKVVSSSASAPKVDTAVAKDTLVVVLECSKAATQAETNAHNFRDELRTIKSQLEAGRDIKTGLEAAKKVNATYRTDLVKLDKELSELHDAIAAERGDQLDWKKKFGATKRPDAEKLQKTVKELIGKVVKRLEELESETLKVREAIAKGGHAEEDLFEKAIHALAEQKDGWGKQLVSAIASPFSAEEIVAPFLERVKKDSKAVRDDLQSLSKAATAK